jgi:hypothetical protein
MILLPRKGMSRRTVLRGLVGSAVASVGLPLLDGMLNGNGTALAQGGPLPTRFVLWFWGNGIRREHWTPDQIGTNWQPKAELAPLISAGLRDDLNVVTGLDIKTATHPHHSGMTGILTGAHYHQVGTTRDTIVSTFAHPSVDQIAAAHFEGQTPFRSIELAVCRFRGTDEGTTFQHLSHNGVNDVNPSEYSPIVAYERLFGLGPSDTEIDLARRSVLDAVMDQVRGLQDTVGQRDRTRLERHFDSIRTLEQRLAAGQVACARPDVPGQFRDVEGREQIAEKNAAMSEIMAYALACDLTRASSVMFSSAGSGVVVWQAGAPNGLHQLCHDENNPQPIVHASVTFMMEQFAVFLNALKSMPEGGGTLLDNCSVMATTELSEGKTHTNDEFPVLLAGRGGGRLRTGLHVRTNRDNASKAGLTALRGAGLPMPNFGYDAGLVTDPLGDILI